MNKHILKMIAPIVITALAVVYYMVYFQFLSAMLSGLPRVLLGILPIILAAATVFVCIQRILEIRSGEEDDLDNY